MGHQSTVNVVGSKCSIFYFIKKLLLSFLFFSSHSICFKPEHFMLARATIVAADSQRFVRWSARWCKFIYISMFPSFFFLSLSHSFLSRFPASPYRTVSPVAG